MRKVLLTFIAIISFSTIAMAQFRIGKAPDTPSVPEVEQKQTWPMVYSDVIFIPGVSKDDLYNRAKLALANIYLKSSSIIDFEDRFTGMIVGKPKTLILEGDVPLAGSAETTGDIQYTITITVKDGRFKYTFSDFIHEKLGKITGSSDPIGRQISSKKAIERVKSTIDQNMKDLQISLIEKMKTPAPSEENW